jgi:hypothetical protein
MKKILLIPLCFLTLNTFAQIKKVKTDTITPYKKTYVWFNRKTEIDSLVTTNLPVATNPDSILSVGTGQLISKTPTTLFTSIPIGTGGTGSIFFKQTSTGNFSTDSRYYYDSVTNRSVLNGRKNYTPRNTTQSGADSLTTKITSAMTVRVIDVTILKSITIEGIMIDTTGAVNGDEILIRNASPNGSTFSIADTIGSSVLFNSGTGRFVFEPMSNMYLTCQKRNNKTWWVEITRSSITAR